MTTETDLARQLADAQRSGSRSVDQGALASIDRAAAYRIQLATMAALNETPGMFKLAVASVGNGAIAPIYASRVGNSGTLKLKSASVTGLEVEVGVVLGRDLPPGSNRAAVEAAVGRYYMGIEICGTRYADRTKAVYDAGLADNMSAFGYAIEPADWERKADLDGLTVDLSFAGKSIYSATAKHGFGGVLEPVVAYAKLSQQPYPLKAGAILTTGSLCGLVATSGPGLGVAKLGGHTVEVELA